MSLLASTRALRHATARAVAATGSRALATTTNTLPPLSPSTSPTEKPNDTIKDSASAEGPKKKKHLIFGNRGPSLQDFLNASNLKSLDPNAVKLDDTMLDDTPYLSVKGPRLGAGAKYFVEVYGCQMNVNDTEILMSIMNSAGYVKADDQGEADIVFLVTCAIRENAEAKIWNRLAELKRRKLGPMKDKAPLVGVLGVS